MPLSDFACQSAKPREKPYKMGDEKGLYLQIMPTGSKLWRYKYRYAGKEKRLALGAYPEVSLKKAREECLKARALLAEYKDPSVAKQETKRLAMASAANTFEAMALEWHERNKVKWKPKHAATVLSRLRKDLFPAIGNLPVKDITTPRIAAVIEGIEKRGAYVIARRALQYSRAVFAYAKLKGKIENNPADVKAKDFLVPTKPGHFAAMDTKDLPLFLKKLHNNEANLFIQTQYAIEFMLLTFVRTNELINARWEEFDLEKKQWLIPGSRMKMGKDHIVPLSNQVLVLIEKLKLLNGKREWVFVNQHNPRKPMSNGAILMAVKRMGYGGIHTAHGFRALAMTTIMEELGYPYEIPDIQLGHSKGDDIRRAYDRTKFLPERKKMMQEWADYIDKIAKESSK